jgi:hypothetical protein
MLNWLNRQKFSTATSTAAYPQPSLADWRNREKPGNKHNTVPAPRSRKLKSLELFSIAVVIALIVGVDLYIFGINKRLSALESEFVEVKAWAFPASLLEGKYASLNARLRALTEAYSDLDAKVASGALQQQPSGTGSLPAGDETPAVTQADSGAGAAGDVAVTVTEAVIPSEAPAAGIARRPAADSATNLAETTGVVRREGEPTPAMATTQIEPVPVIAPGAPAGSTALALHFAEDSPVTASSGKPADPRPPVPAMHANPPQGSGKAAPWVINLLSDPNEALAEEFAASARDRGITVEQNRTEVKGRVYWRVQITGFETAGEARARAETVKEKLRLKDVWIFKQQG